MSKLLHYTLYYVGDDPDDAYYGFPFDNLDDAQEYKKDNDYEHIYSAKAVVDFETFKEVE